MARGELARSDWRTGDYVKRFLGGSGFYDHSMSDLQDPRAEEPDCSGKRAGEWRLSRIGSQESEVLPSPSSENLECFKFLNLEFRISNSIISIFVESMILGLGFCSG